MVGEKFDGDKTPTQEITTEWDILLQENLNEAQATEETKSTQEEQESSPEREKLENEVEEKIANNSGWGKTFKKIAFTAFAVALVTIGGLVTKDHLEEKQASETIRIQEIANNIQEFMDDDSENVVMMCTIKNGKELSREINKETIEKTLQEPEFRFNAVYNIEWWGSSSNIYGAIDTDADGNMDIASKLNVLTNDQDVISLEHDDGAKWTMSKIEKQFEDRDPQGQQTNAPAEEQQKISIKRIY